jgi:hypothetical protein
VPVAGLLDSAWHAETSGELPLWSACLTTSTLPDWVTPSMMHVMSAVLSNVLVSTSSNRLIQIALRLRPPFADSDSGRKARRRGRHHQRCNSAKRGAGGCLSCVGKASAAFNLMMERR